MDKASGLKQIGSRLSVYRQNRNMTQEELAGRIGVTPQALSKWERGLSLPDISMLADISRILGISTDYLLGVEAQEANGSDAREAGPMLLEIGNFLRSSLEPLELVFGKSLIELFADNRFVDRVVELRKNLSREGIWMPILRLRDELRLEDQEFMVLAYQNVLYSECVEKVDENTLEHMLGKLGEVVRGKYHEILNPDIIKVLVDNLKIGFPALIEGVVPERISYGLLTEVARKILSQGDSILFLPKMIEISDNVLRRNPDADADELAAQIRNAIEREDNFWVVMHSRSKGLKCS